MLIFLSVYYTYIPWFKHVSVKLEDKCNSKLSNALIMHVIFFCRQMKIMVAMVREIVKMSHKHMDLEKTLKLFELPS